jgi:hypothetical protein
MLNFQLDELILVSHTERRARKVQFHPGATVIRGQNDTGKSSLIKSIFLALGATPAKIHERWETASVASLISFKINDGKWSLYRHGRSYSLFDANREMVGTFTSVTNELGPHLAGMFDFRLLLVDQEGKSKIPPPAFLFLPLYIDQDEGWTRNWSSFANLRQFKNPRHDVVYYHAGIRPNEWYSLKAKARELSAKREEPLHRERILKEVTMRLAQRLSNAKFDVDLAAYKRQIDRLLEQCESLKKKEQHYKDKLVELESERIRLEAQKEIVLHARQELDADYGYAAKILDEHVNCPTCGAIYANDFAERFSIARDQDRCSSLLQQIQIDLIELAGKITDQRGSLSETSREYIEVSRLLAEKQGKITLKGLIENEGKREVSAVLQGDIEIATREIAELDSELREIEGVIDGLEDKQRARRIAEEYRSWMHQYLSWLNVTTLREPAFKAIDSNIGETGSDLPRSLLAYFLSILQIIQKHGLFTHFPMVIDAPNQQEQDTRNLKRMLEVIRDHRPSQTQLVLGLVDDCGIDFGGSVVEMTERNYALIQSDYSDLARHIRPYEDANIEA